MRRRTKTAMRKPVLTLAIVILSCLLPIARIEEEKTIHAQTPEQIALPNESGYAGLTRCAACHFKQYENWKASAHAKAFDYLPTKYRKNAECLQCHTSRHSLSPAGKPLPNNLPGVSCEDCHGPGREHANMALTFVGRDQVQELTEENVELLRSKIQRLALDQCIQCHLSQAHKSHPKFDRGDPAKRRQQRNPPRARGFFNVHE